MKDINLMETRSAICGQITVAADSCERSPGHHRALFPQLLTDSKPRGFSFSSTIIPILTRINPVLPIDTPIHFKYILILSSQLHLGLPRSFDPICYKN